jgi:L-rhamnonate dehydratase
MYQLPLANGGAFHWQNAHLMAGVSSGWMTECHLMIAQTSETILVNAPKPEGGGLSLSEKPGLGLEPDEAAVKERTER